jgi:fumarate hydratase subunit alpha
MRTIAHTAIVTAVERLCLKAACELPADVRSALEDAVENERSPLGKSILEQCLLNARTAQAEHMPICQDTGFAVVFVELGADARIEGGLLTDAIAQGVQSGYRNGYLRMSLVDDPLFSRKNTGDNTPPSVQVEIVAGDALTITLLPKGGGSENISALAMLKPADGRDGVVKFVVDTVVKAGGNPCPPVIVGVGIGGTADAACLLAKRALLRPLGTKHEDARYAELEETLLRRINASGNGPQGLGGTTTAFAVHIETMACHMASLPVAVTLNCHAARRATVVL